MKYSDIIRRLLSQLELSTGMLIEERDVIKEDCGEFPDDLDIKVLDDLNTVIIGNHEIAALASEAIGTDYDAGEDADIGTVLRVGWSDDGYVIMRLPEFGHTVRITPTEAMEFSNMISLQADELFRKQITMRKH